jgi:hypothetical protein
MDFAESRRKRYCFFLFRPLVYRALALSQRTPTLSLKQWFFDLKATVDLSRTSYNKNLEAVSARLNRLPKRYATALSGLEVFAPVSDCPVSAGAHCPVLSVSADPGIARPESLDG